MYEMKNVARLLQLNGGLEALTGRPIEVEIPANGPLNPGGPLSIKHVGAGIVEPRHEMISVAFMVEHKGDLVAFPELHFEVRPGRDKRRGWASGSWLIISNWNGKALRSDKLTYRHRGWVYSARRRVREYGDFLRHMDGFVDAGVIASFERQVGGDGTRRMAERLDLARHVAVHSGRRRSLKTA